MTRQFGVLGGILGPVAVASLSPSSASTFEQCPLRWRFRYVDRIPDPPGPDAVVGTFAHLVLEHLLELAPDERTNARARALAGQLIGAYRATDDYQRTWGGDDRAFAWRAWWAITGLWRLERPDRVQVVATEQRLRVQLGGIPFVGVLDRLDSVPGGVEVVDYKCGKPPYNAQARRDKLRQLLYYAGAAETLGWRVRRVRLLFVAHARTVAQDVTWSDITEAFEQLSATWADVNQAVDSDEFEARPGTLCGWCPYVNRCPAGRDEVERRIAAGKTVGPAYSPESPVSISG